MTDQSVVMRLLDDRLVHAQRQLRGRKLVEGV